MSKSLPRMGLGRRLIGWIAAYSFILHVVFAGAVATQLAAANAASGVSGFELCVTDADGASVPAHGKSQHENCAIHCQTVAAGGPALQPVAVALRHPLLAERQVDYSCSTGCFDLLRRAGLGSRAPPLPA